MNAKELEARKYVEDFKNTQLNIAVTGECGSGKSTFVNAFRGMKNSDDGAAPTGVGQTTMKPEKYPHPVYPNVILWDLPGIGSTKFPADKYLEHVKFKTYDFFIIVSADRFTENDAKLAQEIMKMGKKFYFVRSKMDCNLRDEERSKKEYNEEKTLLKIKTICIKELEEQGVAHPQVFLVSSLDLHLYDFSAFHETLERELPNIRNAKQSKMSDNRKKAELEAKKYLEDLKNTKLNIAVTGECGSGKSTFVNAFRGMKNSDDGAAPTGVVETTTKPEKYPHPVYPNVILWDLPGIRTTKYAADQYLEHVQFKTYDFFIIVSDDRFTENDAKLVQEIKKMGKKFYFVRSKMDNSLRDVQRDQRDQYDEEKTIQKIRQYCIKGLEEQGVAHPQVFLVSSFDLHLYDFPALHKTLERELPTLKRDVLILALPSIRNAKESNMSDDIKAAELQAKKYVEDLKNTKLNIAVTGESGSGKSTLVNAFRGMKNYDDGAAPTGVVETTTKPEKYPHPVYPNVILWDLPGIGTTKFPADRYLEHVGFKTYDFFIIISDDRFTENDGKLAQEIKKMGKKFYFVRSKMDNSIRDARRDQRDQYDEEKTLQKIRQYCKTGLEEQGVKDPQVFLLSSVDLHLYDFSALQETLERELSSIKRDVLILGLPNISSRIITKKKEVFSSQIKYFALLSAGVAAIPVPGLSLAVDVGILVGVLISYLKAFGLDVKSLEKVSSDTNTPLGDLLIGFKSPFSGKEVTGHLVVQILKSSASILLATAAEDGFRLIPICGSVIAASISFITTYMFLNNMLNSLSDDAEMFLKEVVLSVAYKSD